MRYMRSTLMVAVVALVATPALAAAIKSGLQPGKFLNPFDVVKCGPSSDDGVKLGSTLCYRCKYGGRPMVMVFAHNADEKLAALVKKLDEAVAKHKDHELAAFVNLLGEGRDSLEETAKGFGSKNSVKHVPIVVPVENENGPGDYGLNPDADVTIIMASGGKVLANHALEKGKLDDEAVKAVLADLPKLLK